MLVEKYVKAVAAFVVTLVVLFGGDEVSNNIDVNTVGTLISALLVAVGVGAAPANRG